METAMTGIERLRAVRASNRAPDFATAAPFLRIA